MELGGSHFTSVWNREDQILQRWFSVDDLDKTKLEILAAEDTRNERAALSVKHDHVLEMMGRTCNNIQALSGDNETFVKPTLADLKCLARNFESLRSNQDIKQLMRLTFLLCSISHCELVFAEF